MDLGLNSKNAIITGGSDGIGLAAAISLSKEGANVAILARTQEKLDNAVKEIQKDAKGKVLAISTDVRDESSVINSINKVKDEFGKIDILPFSWRIKDWYRVFFFTGTPLKSSKYGKVNLG